MINFIIGRAGSGKSHTVEAMISNEIKNTDRQIVLLVPEQQTVVWETRMAKILPASANLRLEITNFTRLSNSVFREYGGLTDTLIDEGSRVLLVWRAMISVMEHLTVYNSGHEDRNIPHLTNAIDELKASGITPSEAEAALNKLRAQRGNDSGRTGDLISRLSDAIMVYSAYESILHEEHIDKGDLLQNLAKVLGESGYFKNKSVYIDSFFSLTAAEERILARIIGQAENVTVTFSCPTEYKAGFEEVQFAEIRQFMKNTAGAAAKAGGEINKILLPDNRRHADSAELSLIEKELFNYTEAKNDANFPELIPAEDVKIIKCADRFDEAEATAAIIESLLRQGYRNSDIAVVTGDISAREGIIDTVLRRHGIRCFMSEPESVSTSPAVKLVLAALGVAIGGWQRKNIIHLLKTGMTPAGKGIDPDTDTAELFEGDFFETYTGTWNIHGKRMYTGDDWCMNPDGYSSEITDSGKVVLRLANQAKNKIIPPLHHFLSVFDKGAAPVREICESIVYFAEEYRVCDSLEQMAEEYRGIGMPADAEKTVASWDCVCEILDKMVTMLGDTNLDAARFSGLFARVAASMDVGTIPTGIDEVVLGSAESVRFDTVKCVIILGSVNGEFPRAVRDGGEFFNDRDKTELESVGIELTSPDGEMKTAREYFMYYRAAVSPAEKLYVLAPVGDGSELSEGALRIGKILESIGRECVTSFASMPLSEVVFCKAGAEYQLSRRRDPEEIAIIRTLLDEGHGEYKVPLTARFDTIKSSLADTKNINLSQSKIDSFIHCPFNYSCKYIMKIAPEPKAEIGSLDVGTFIHHVIEKFFVEVPGERIKAGDISAEELYEISDRIIADYLSTLSIFPNGGADGRIDYLFIRLKRYVPLFLEAILRELAQSEFYPVAHELQIGLEPGNVPPITFVTEDGTGVTLQGIADRVDLCEKDGVTYVRVVDYKTGKKTFSLDNVSRGIDIQLLVYLFTLWKFGVPELKIHDALPAGAVYLNVRPNANSVSSLLSAEEAAEFTIDNIERSGIFLADEDVLTAMDKELCGKYISVKRSNTGLKTTTSATIMTLDDFGGLYNQLEEIIKKVATDMKEGHSEAAPLGTGDDSPCKYCNNKYICRVIAGRRDD